MTCWFALAAGINLLAGQASPSPPTARKVAKVEVVHGEKRQDDYFWLRRKDDPQVRAYLDSENAYTDSLMKPTEPLQEKLYSEMLGRIKETDLTVPYRKGAFLYYSRTEKGKQYPILCRSASPGAAEHVVLDLNVLAAGKKFLGLGGWQVSDDGNRLAYIIDESGFRKLTANVVCPWSTAHSTRLFPGARSAM